LWWVVSCVFPVFPVLPASPVFLAFCVNELSFYWTVRYWVLPACLPPANCNSEAIPNQGFSSPTTLKWSCTLFPSLYGDILTMKSNLRERVKLSEGDFNVALSVALQMPAYTVFIWKLYARRQDPQLTQQYWPKQKNALVPLALGRPIDVWLCFTTAPVYLPYGTTLFILLAHCKQMHLVNKLIWIINVLGQWLSKESYFYWNKQCCDRGSQCSGCISMNQRHIFRCSAC
jgi:hypothetical protein